MRLRPGYRALLVGLCLAAAGAQAKPPLECGGLYVLERGDYLAQIARRLSGPRAQWRDVWAVNRAALAGADPSDLPVGTILFLPCAEDMRAGNMRAVQAPERRIVRLPAPDPEPLPTPESAAAPPVGDDSTARTPSEPAPAPAPLPEAVWLGAPEDPARALLARALRRSGLGWKLGDADHPGALLRAPLERAGCATPACRKALWSAPLREMTLISLRGPSNAPAPDCLSAGVAALRGETGPGAGACLDMALTGGAPYAVLTDVEVEGLTPELRRSLPEAAELTRLIKARASLAPGLRAQFDALQGALARSATEAAQPPRR